MWALGTCREPNEIKGNTNPKNTTAPSASLCRVDEHVAGGEVTVHDAVPGEVVHAASHVLAIRDKVGRARPQRPTLVLELRVEAAVLAEREDENEGVAVDEADEGYDVVVCRDL